MTRSFRVAGLFAGIGGLEVGFHRHGHTTEFLCEIDKGAAEVLRRWFPEVPVHDDIRSLQGSDLPAQIDLITAGFPCQDLSQAGRTTGIAGSRSGLVTEVFRLLRKRQIPWVVVENVPFMLQLAGGAAMDLITEEFDRLGYRWAYRVVDSRAFGLPQRRERVFFIASLETNPATFLFSSDAGRQDLNLRTPSAFGFYWTEGNRGLGWAEDAVPTLKGGSGLGIPSSPAIWFADGRIATPDIRDAERLQGFPADWTQPSEAVARPSYRWKLVGNAVTVDSAAWVAERLTSPAGEIPGVAATLNRRGSWPKAAFGSKDGHFVVDVSSFPKRQPTPKLEVFLQYPIKPLSLKATAGFVDRLTKSTLRYPPEFLDALQEHLARAHESKTRYESKNPAARTA